MKNNKEKVEQETVKKKKKNKKVNSLVSRGSSLVALLESSSATFRNLFQQGIVKVIKDVGRNRNYFPSYPSLAILKTFVISTVEGFTEERCANNILHLGICHGSNFIIRSSARFVLGRLT